MEATTYSATAWRVRLQNEVFSNASLGTRDWLSVALYLFFLVALIGVIVGVVTGFVTKRIIKQRMETLLGRSLKVLQKILSVILAMSLAGILFIGVIVGFLAYVDLQLNASFNQRLAAIGPYIQDADEKVLRSAWALMRTRGDYVKINAIFEKHAKTAKITLPDPLYE